MRPAFDGLRARTVQLVDGRQRRTAAVAQLGGHDLRLAEHPVMFCQPSLARSSSTTPLGQRVQQPRVAGDVGEAFGSSSTPS